MEKITCTEFLDHLKKYGTAVHCEMYFGFYKTDLEGNPAEELYYDRGCVICAHEYDYNGQHHMFYRIHQVSADSEIDAVTEEWKERASAVRKKYENPWVNVTMYYVSNGHLPPEKDQYFGWRNFARMGEAVPPDPRVRELTAADAEIIKTACAAAEKDTGEGKDIASRFPEYDFDFWAGKQKLFGIFDAGKLSGIATACYVRDFDLAWLMDIVIFPEYRGKGYGKALVLSALSEYPDKKWHYQVARDNAASIALARSLGFTLEGAGLYVYW